MPVHEQQSVLANNYAKVGLAGRAGGRAEALGSAEQVEYALGDVSPAATATTVALEAGRPAGLIVSSPAAATIRVAFTPEDAAAGITDYAIYRDSTLIGTSTTGAQQDIAGQPAGSYTVTVRSRDDDATEFTTSAGAAVTVA